jgi:putative flippase GtrA
MQQLIRYGLIGLTTNALIYLIYLGITYFGIPPKIAMTLVYIVGVFIGFFGNRKFTFLYRGNAAGSLARLILVHFFGYCLNYLILSVFVDNFGYNHQWVQIVAIVFVAAFLFTAFKYFVFRKII